MALGYSSPVGDGKEWEDTAKMWTTVLPGQVGVEPLPIVQGSEDVCLVGMRGEGKSVDLPVSDRRHLQN